MCDGRYNRKVVLLILLLALALLLAADLLGPPVWMTTVLAIDERGSVAGWFEFALFLGSGSLLLTAVVAEKQAGTGNTWRWGLFAVVMLYLSANSAVELTHRLVDRLVGWNWRLWLVLNDFVIFLVLAVILLVVLGPVIRQMQPAVRWRFFLAGLVFALGAILVGRPGRPALPGATTIGWCCWRKRWRILV